MEFRKFVEEVKVEAERLCGDEYDISVQETLKDNGNVLTGLAFTKKGKEGSAISPTIYLECYYERYTKDGMSVGNVAGEILASAIAAVKRNHLLPSFAADLADFEKIKGKIHYRLVDYGENQELLKKVPFMPYCGLAIIFYILKSRWKL